MNRYYKMGNRCSPEVSCEKMFSKLIQIAVVFGCLILSFGAAEFPSSKWNENSSQSYRLPNDTKPETYNISFRTGISEGHFDYDGHVSINILAVNATRAITLHSRSSTIQKIQLDHANDSGNDTVIDLLQWTTNADKEFLIIPTKNVELQPGSRYRLQITFNGTLEDEIGGFYRVQFDDFGNWIATTHFDPHLARQAFPCYNEPGLKANVTIRITHGTSYTAVSNMPGTRHNNSDGTVTTLFATSPVMSTNMIAFAVTDFLHRSNAANASLPMTIYVTPSGINRTRVLLEETEKAVKAFEKYFEVLFPLPKFDIMVTYPALETFPNWGLMATNMGSLVDDDTTIYDEYTNAEEVAYQYFGSLVTPKWYTFAWLREGLATFSGYIVSREMLPHVDVMEDFIEASRFSMKLDDTNSSEPITRYVGDFLAIDFLFVRFKGMSLTQMFFHALTEASFKKGITNYLRNNAYLTVDEDVLFDELDRAVKEDGTLDPSWTVNQLFSTWTRQAGYPLLTVTRNYQNGSITISQERYLNDTSSDLINATTWWIPYNFATANSASFNDTSPQGWLAQHQRTQLIEPSGKNSWNASEWVLFNKQQTGLYRVMYDARNWKLLIDELHAGPNCRIPPANRAQLIDDAFNFEESGRLPAGLLLEMVKYLKHETEWAPWNAAGLALLHLNSTLFGTEAHKGFLGMVLLSVRSAMAAKQCECGSIVPVCAILEELDGDFDFGICPDPDTDDLLMKTGNKFYRRNRIANCYKTV